jgi:hypothetical protein
VTIYASFCVASLLSFAGFLVFLEKVPSDKEASSLTVLNSDCDDEEDGDLEQQSPEYW